MPAVSEGNRFPQLDLIKALGALLVVMVHCMRAHWDPGVTHFEVWHGAAFAILVTPAFLFCAGFLAARDTPLGRDVVTRRCRRLLWPYLLATALAEVYRAFYLREPIHPLWDLLLANAFGVYYFVFHLALLTPLSLALSRFPARVRRTIWLLFLATGAFRSYALWVTDRDIDPQWGFLLLVRNPFVYWGFYLSGWEYRLHRERVQQFMDRHRDLLSAALTAVMVAGGIEAWFAPPGQTPWLSYPLIYAAIGLPLVVPSRRLDARIARAIRWVSDRTYSFYLFHLFFVVAAMRMWPQPSGAFSVPLFLGHYAAGLGGVGVALALRDRWLPGRGHAE